MASIPQMPQPESNPEMKTSKRDSSSNTAALSSEMHALEQLIATKEKHLQLLKEKLMQIKSSTQVRDIFWLYPWIYE